MKTLSINVSDRLYAGLLQFVGEDIVNPTQTDVEFYLSNFLEEEDNETGNWSPKDEED